jgi:hypothetical protein
MRRYKKGHRYIVLSQGPPEPPKDTQAVPQNGALNFCVLWLSKLAVLTETTTVQ